MKDLLLMLWVILVFLLYLILSGCGFYPECGAYAHDGTTEDGPMCAERLHRELRVSSQFTEAERSQIMAAGEDWNTATGSRVQLSWVWLVPGEDGSADVVPAHFEGDRSGQQWSSTGLIELESAPADGLIRAHMVHELGHSFGLGHVDDQTQAMHPNSGVLVTPADVEHFDRLWRNTHD